MTKEKAWSKDGMQQIIKTGHKTFDQQTVCVSRGNTISPTHLGLNIRAYNTPENPVGDKCEFGAMQEWDLKNFRHFEGFRYYVEPVVKEMTKTEGAYVHVFFSTSKTRRIVHGYAIVRGTELLWRMTTGPTYKSRNILTQCLSYIVDEGIDNE